MRKQNFFGKIRISPKKLASDKSIAKLKIPKIDDFKFFNSRLISSIKSAIFNQF